MIAAQHPKNIPMRSRNTIPPSRSTTMTAFVIGLSLAVCSCNASKGVKGGAIGAGAGAGIGAVIGNQFGDHGTAVGAIIGAAVGGTAGAVIGHKM